MNVTMIMITINNRRIEMNNNDDDDGNNNNNNVCTDISSNSAVTRNVLY